jgi:septum formation protein
MSLPGMSLPGVSLPGMSLPGMSLQRRAPPLVLASASAARRALLEAAGLRFDTRPAHVDEAALKRTARADGLDAGAAALLLADAKARQVAGDDPAALVIGCDQLLLCEGEWFDKPASLDEARAHLRALRGRTHTLVTAVLCRRGDQRLWGSVARPRLTMRGFSDAFLETYLRLESDLVTSTVGAYRLEGPGVQLFAAVEGEHAAILGLPLLALLGFLREYGLLEA